MGMAACRFMVPFAYRLQCTWQWGHVFQQSPKWRFSSRPLPGLPTDDVRHRNGKYKFMSQGILRYWGCDWMSNRRSRTWKAMGMAACRFMVPFAYRLQCTWQWGHVFQQSPKWRFSSRPLPCLPTGWIFTDIWTACLHETVWREALLGVRFLCSRPDAAAM